MSKEQHNPNNGELRRTSDQAIGPPSEKSFSSHLCWHIDNGTRPNTTASTSWEKAKFLASINAKGCAADSKMLDGWLAGGKCQYNQLHAIQIVLFGTSPVGPQAIWSRQLSEALRESWRRGSRLRTVEEGSIEQPPIGSTVGAYLGPRFRKIRWDDKHPPQHPYEPTQQEYLAGHVVRPQITDDVVQRLQAERWAIVLGRGASGKTVFGNLLSLDRDLCPTKSFYLDVGRYQDSIAFEPVSRIAFEDIKKTDLLIVDNIHLDEDLAHDIWREWSELIERPFLILLGRELRRRDGFRFSTQSLEPIILLAREREVRGVFDRLARRRLVELDATAPNPPRIPEAAAKQWLQEFGGPPDNPNTTVDLMMLSVAIRRNIDQLLQEKWLLRVADAKDEARNKYLAVDERERRNLIRLAATPDDFRLRATALYDPFYEFPESVKRGIVFESELSTAPLSYSFAHSALGRLIAEASGHSINWGAERREIATISPRTALAIARECFRDQKLAEGRAILEASCSSEDWIDRFEGHLGHLHYLVATLARENLIDDERLARNLVIPPNALEGLVERSSFGAILTFLGVAAEIKFVRTKRAVLIELSKDPRGLIAKLWPGAVDRMANLLNDLKENGDVKSVRETREMILVELKENPDKLAEKVLVTPFGQLASFLTFLKSSDFGQLRDALIAELTTEEKLWKLGANASGESLQDLVSFMEIDELAAQVLARVDQEEWDAVRIQEPASQPDFFISIARNLRRFGRPELARVPAKIQLAESNAQHWQAPGIGIRNLSNVIALASPTTAEEERKFITNAITTSWLDAQYQNASIGTLCASIFALLSHLDQANWPRFALPSLEARTFISISRLDSSGPSACAEAISLHVRFDRGPDLHKQEGQVFEFRTINRDCIDANAVN